MGPTKKKFFDELIDFLKLFPFVWAGLLGTIVFAYMDDFLRAFDRESSVVGFDIFQLPFLAIFCVMLFTDLAFAALYFNFRSLWDYYVKGDWFSDLQPSSRPWFLLVTFMVLMISFVLTMIAFK
jgi:hypothetical protein